VPLAFPSHQGLIAFLWRRWPRTFDVLACCVGAAVPDVVDGLLGLARAHLGQWLGHGLLGLFALDLPAGLALTLAAAALAARLPPDSKVGAHLRAWGATSAAARPGARARILCVSVLAGSFSHLAFDFVSHGNFLWLCPWYDNPSFFPAWWYARWLEIPLPFYPRPYPVGPHLLVWTFLSLLGAILLARRPPARRSGSAVAGFTGAGAGRAAARRSTSACPRPDGGTHPPAAGTRHHVDNRT
jgi:hypothetical protein